MTWVVYAVVAAGLCCAVVALYESALAAADWWTHRRDGADDALE